MDRIRTVATRSSRKDEIGSVEVWQASCNGYYRSESGRIVTQCFPLLSTLVVPIFVINLPKSRRRRQSVVTSFRRAGVSGYEFVPAIDGSKLPQHELDRCVA